MIPYDASVKEMKGLIQKTYGMKGEKIVSMNWTAIDRGGDVNKIDVPVEWKDLEPEVREKRENVPEFVRDVADRINHLEGDQVPVSAFVGREDGSFPAGTTQYEKRGIAVNVPEWIPENCIQCNQCAYVCPHAVIRPFLITDEELKNAPEETKTVEGKGGVKGYHYKIQVSVLDCTGCSNCVEICPAKEKALVMKPLETQNAEIERWNYMNNKVGYKDNVVAKDKTVTPPTDTPQTAQASLAGSFANIRTD